LSPSFGGKPLERSEPMFSEHENNAFMIDGKWKLVGRGVSSPIGPEVEKWELYNLREDRTELSNLALTKKDRLKIMAKAWYDWSLKDKVYPKPLKKNRN
jgi:arylsulfatase